MAEYFDPFKTATVDLPQSYRERLDADPNLFHVVCEQPRAGLTMFLRVLELDHFKPGTKDNDAYNMVLVQWSDIPWVVLSVPKRFEAVVRSKADELGFRIADGVPHCISTAGVERFPMHSERVWKLEYKESSIGYTALGREQIDAIAEKQIKAAERRYAEWYDKQRRFWFRGQLWIRLDHSEQPPDNAAMWTRIGESVGHPRYWYTMKPVDPAWRPYPE
jgi:hypothetical protein